MEPNTFLWFAVPSAWFLLFLLLKLLEGSQNRGVLYRFLNYYHLEISIGFIKWQTNSYNQLIRNFTDGSRWKRTFFSFWFTVGTFVSLLLSLGSVVLLMYNLYFLLTSPTGSQAIVTPLVPGVNIPVSQVPYLIVALFISAIFHELGHAMSAVNLGKRFHSVGVLIFIIFPGAFVNFVDEFEDLSPFQKLKIYCAGAWHNVVIVLLVLMISSSLTLWMSPLYSYGSGISVVKVDENSPIFSHFEPYDTIVSINNCHVQNMDDWRYCLIALLNETSPIGNCVPQLAIAMADKSVSCCEKGYSGSLQCFSSTNLEEEENNNNTIAEYCLSARQVLIQPPCENDMCHEGMDCLVPKVEEEESLLNIEKEDGTFVLFLGHPSLLYSYILGRDYTPKWDILRSFDLHFHIENLLFFLTSISSALAILNMAPVFMLDGQWACLAVCDLLFGRVAPHHRHSISQCILWSGTALFVTNLLLSTISLFISQ